MQVSRLPRRAHAGLVVASAFALGLACARHDEAWGAIIQLATLGIVLGCVVGRAQLPRAPAPAWPYAVERFGRLLRAGSIGGFLLGGSHAAMIEYLRATAANVAPGNLSLHRMSREASLGAGVGTAVGFLLALAVGALAVPLSWHGRGKASTAETHHRTCLAARFGLVVVPVLFTLGGLEALLANDWLVSGCSSGCGVYEMSVESRVFGAALTTVALLCASLLCAAAKRRDRSPRFAAAIAACLGVVVFSIFQSYAAISSTLANDCDYRWGWLGFTLVEIPTVSLTSPAILESDVLGRSLVVYRPDGVPARARLSLGPWRIARADDLVLDLERKSASP